MTIHTQHLIPPLNFGIIEEGLYRSGQPYELSFPFLEKLGLRTVVYLAPEEPNAKFCSFLEENRIDLHHLGQVDPISESVVLAALNLILDPKLYPLMVCCNLGRHRTGIVVGCLRKLQRWSLTSIFEEYRRFAAGKVRLLNEQFVELFDTDLVRVPVDRPLFLKE